MSCFVISTSNKGNSVSDYFFAIGEELVKRGHQVYLLIDGKHPNIEKLSSNPAILSWPSNRPNKWKDAQYFFKLSKKISPDIIIGNFSSVNLMIFIGWLTKIPNRIIWGHTLSSQQKHDSQHSIYYDYFLHIRKRPIYFLGTKLVANSIATKLDMQKTYGIPSSKCLVLPFLIADPLLNMNKNIKRESFEIVCVGRLHPSKGQETLIRAVPHIRRKFPKVKIYFIGDGPCKFKYEQLTKKLGVKDCCKFLGSLDLKQVFKRMESATICVSPSKNEAFGLVNIEAQAVGTPVVASAVDGIMETVLNEETGFLVSPGDIKEFANKINQLLENDDLRDRFSSRSRSHFISKFSIKTNLHNHALFFEKLISR